MRHHTTRTCAALLALAALIALPGCITVEGAGDDIEEVGDAIGDAARDASD